MSSPSPACWRGPQAPVGVFDSGVGGLTVARAIIAQLPDEDIVYVVTPAMAPTVR